MSVKIRLKRIGMTKQPFYRLVAIDHRRASSGTEIEILGNYNPKDKKNAISYNKERVSHWLSCGARLSDTARSLLKRSGFFLDQKKPVQEETPR